MNRTFKFLFWILFFVAVSLFFTLAGAMLSHAGQATLAWDANDQAPDGYVLFLRTAGKPYDYSKPVWSGTATSASIDNLADGSTCYFVVRAFIGTNQSGDSNEVAYVVPVASADVETPSDLYNVNDDIKTILATVKETLALIKGEAAQSTQSYCGNPTSMIVHKSSHWCGEGARRFDSVTDATALGYKTCSVCKP